MPQLQQDGLNKEPTVKARGTVGILFNDYGPYQKNISKQIAAVLAKKGFATLCISGRELQLDDSETAAAYTAANKIYDLVAHTDLAGLIVLSSSLSHHISNQQLTNFLSKFKQPAVVSVGVKVEGKHSILIDNKTSMTALMQHLCSNPENKRFAFIKGWDNPDSKEREDVVRCVLKEKGLELKDELVIDGKFSSSHAFAATNELLRQTKAIDVIVAANDAMAFGAMQALRKHGLSVPFDVRVVGFDDIPQSSSTIPSLTTIKQDLIALGSLAAQRVLELIEGAQLEELSYVATQLVIRKSCNASQAKLEKTATNPSESLSFEQCLNLSLSTSSLRPDFQEDLRASFLAAYQGDLSTFLKCWQLELQHNIYDIEALEDFEVFLDKLEQNIIKSSRQSSAFSLPLLRQAHKIILEKSLSLQAEGHFTALGLSELQLQSHLLITTLVDLEEIMRHVAKTLQQYGLQRCFIALYEAPSHNQKIQEYSSLVLALQDKQARTLDKTAFLSHRLLPDSLLYELKQGKLLLRPLYAAHEQFGFILFDPTSVDYLDYEGLTYNISTAIRNSKQLSNLEQHSQQLEQANYDLAQLANFDPLTGLANRTLFKTQLQQAFLKADQNETRVALLFLDLDCFKDVNDSLGHSAGDELLEIVARRIKHNIRPCDSVARLGGDEFTIILNGIEDDDVVEKIAQDILKAFRQPFALANQRIYSSTSIGVTYYPKDGEDSETLLKNADTALYFAKTSGKDCYHFYTPKLNAQLLENLYIEQSMRQGLGRNEFEMHYQARVDLNSQAITGFEALMRWKHKGKNVSPAVFIPIAEKNDLIIQLGSFALKSACKQAKSWQEAGQATRIAVNLSVKQLQQDNIVQHIKNILNHYQLSPKWLELEITESAAMTDVEQNIGKLTILRDLGIHISIDDFGTAYSSLNYLKRLPVSSLKIDKSFVDDVSQSDGGDSVDAAIIKAVIALGKSMGFKLIAEGVETEAQSLFLQSLDCDEAQGYLFSHPLPASEAFAYLCANTNKNNVSENAQNDRLVTL